MNTLPHLYNSLEKRHSTPLAPRISSTRYCGSTEGLSVDSLNELLKKELGGILTDQPGLVDAVFPNQYLPFSVDENLLHSLTTVHFNGRWTGLPLLFNEPTFATWMNDIGSALEKSTGFVRRRVWNPNHHDTPLSGSPIKRKPDIMLLDISNGQSDSTPEWPSVRSICEITSMEHYPSRMCYTLWNKAFIMMNTQFNRLFIPFLSICHHKFWLVVCDRAGVVKSIEYDFHSNALDFLCILAGLMFGDGRLIGHDRSMGLGSNNEIVEITVAGKEYEVVKKIFTSETLRGRGTQCWHVRREGEEYILKDSWAQVGRKNNEIEMLESVKDVFCVPTIVHGEDLQLAEGGPDSTGIIRAGATMTEERVHRRILMQPVGESIFSFTSKKELIGAFIDIIKAHKYLCEQKQILHRDISYNNLMLWHDPNCPGHRRGLIIDFDCASKISHQVDGDYSLGHRTGTGPFMAWEVLFSADDEHIKQKPVHDLESMFYVLLYIFTCFAGPNGLKRTAEDIGQLSSMPILQWFGRHQRYRDLADLKFAHLSSFNQRFKEKISPYFKDLWPLLVSLWDVLFPGPGEPRALKNCKGTHDGLLTILQAHHKSLPMQDAFNTSNDQSISPGPESYPLWMLPIPRDSNGKRPPSPSPSGSINKRIHSGPKKS